MSTKTHLPPRYLIPPLCGESQTPALCALPAIQNYGVNSFVTFAGTIHRRLLARSAHTADVHHNSKEIRDNIALMKHMKYTGYATKNSCHHAVPEPISDGISWGHLDRSMLFRLTAVSPGNRQNKSRCRPWSTDPPYRRHLRAGGGRGTVWN